MIPFSVLRATRATFWTVLWLLTILALIIIGEILVLVLLGLVERFWTWGSARNSVTFANVVVFSTMKTMLILKTEFLRFTNAASIGGIVGKLLVRR